MGQDYKVVKVDLKVLVPRNMHNSKCIGKVKVYRHTCT